MLKILKSVQGLAFMLHCGGARARRQRVNGHQTGGAGAPPAVVCCVCGGCCVRRAACCDDVCLKHKCGRVLTLWKRLNKVLCCFGVVCCVVYLVCCVCVCYLLCVVRCVL